MSRESILNSEIQALLGGRSTESRADNESDLDQGLSDALAELENTLKKIEEEGALFFESRKGMTRIGPTDFNKYGRVPQIRAYAIVIVLNYVIPLIIQSKRLNKVTDVVKAVKEYRKGRIIDTLTRIAAYHPDPTVAKKVKTAREKDMLDQIQTRAKAELSEKPIPVMDWAPDPKGSKNENVRIKAAPEKPLHTITGRFEYDNADAKNADTFGTIICINQAGNWMEGILSQVADGLHAQISAAKTTRNYFRFYAQVTDWRKPINLLKSNSSGKNDTFDFYATNPRITVSTNSRIQLVYINGKSEKIIELYKLSSNAVLMERHFKAIPNELVKKSQWFPLLKRQRENLKSFLKLFRGYSAIHDNPKAETPTLKAEFIKRRAANIETLLLNRDKGGLKEGKELFLTMEQFFDENFHRSDYLLAAFYCRYYLEQKILKSSDKWRLSYLYAMIRYFYLDKFGDFNVTTAIIGGQGAFSAQTVKYDIEVKVSGFGFFDIVGGAYYRGEVTIKCQQWKKLNISDTAVLKISLGEFGMGLGAGVSLEKSFSGTAQTNYLWYPRDFAGYYKIDTVEASADAYDIEGGLLIGQMDLTSEKTGLSITFPVFDGGVEGFGVEFKQGSKEFEADLEVGVIQTIGSGSIWLGSDLQTPDNVLRLSEETANKSWTYGRADKNHFKHDSALLTAGALNALRQMCASELFLLKQKGTKVSVIGHTDRSGSATYNQTLSTNRAENVKQKILDICGSSLEATVTAAGIGEIMAIIQEKKDRVKDPSDRKVEIFINGVIALTLIEEP